MWLHKEQARSSTFQELKAIHNVGLYYEPILRHSKVKIFSDNQTACSIMQKGSTKPLLSGIAVDIFLSSQHGDMQLCPQWIPWSENEQADILSKYVDKDDWKLHPDIFNYLNNLWNHIPWTDSLHTTTIRSTGLIIDLQRRVVKQFMRWHKIGLTKIIGFVLQLR